MEEGKKRLALLVGCNYYNTRNELRGCVNDVHTMRRTLLDRFGFDPDDVTVLTDEPGSAVIPTGENIKRALRLLIDGAEAGDVLFFHYSGHGTTVPPVRVRPHHGPGRNDEAIVPCDFNLITDVDFRELVNRLPHGASLTIISDSCHSGGLIDKEKEQIGPHATPNLRSPADLDQYRRRERVIPFESVLAHLASVSGMDSPHVGDHLSGLFGSEASPGLLTSGTSCRHGTTLPAEPAGGAAVLLGEDEGILLSGCQANETSADVCVGDDGSNAYGAFSNAIRMVLEGNEGVLTNRELVTLVRDVLNRQGVDQHPCLYSSDINADAPFLWQLHPAIERERVDLLLLHSSI